MMKHLLLFVAGGAAALAGRKYSRQISRTVVRGAIQANHAVRQIAAEAASEAALELAGAEREAAPPARRIEAVRTGRLLSGS